jgi:hypothetical protein
MPSYEIVLRALQLDGIPVSANNLEFHRNFSLFKYCSTASGSVADPHHFDACHFDADPDADSDPVYHFDADPDFACHLHADAYPDPDPTFQEKWKTLKIAQLGSYTLHFGLSSAS